MKKTRARSVNCFPQAFDLVRSEILLDDDIPQQEFENLLEISAASICRDAPAPRRARSFLNFSPQRSIKVLFADSLRSRPP